MYYLTQRGASLPLSRFREYQNVCYPDKLYMTCAFDSYFVASVVTTLWTVYEDTWVWVAASRY
jgi:hypothetical protein